MSGVLRLRDERDDASESRKQWEGRIVAEKFSLQNYLGGSYESAVFLTSILVVGGASEKAAIKLICADKTEPEKQLQRWKSARELNHANLIRVFEVGQCEIDDIAYLYVVQEYAEENLSQILPERALTPHETREMLLPILKALQYLHDKGLIHGHIKPSNILAIGNQIKLSNDTMAMMGENGRPKPAGNTYDPPESTLGTVSSTISGTSDVWQVGATLIEALTQNLPAWDRARSRSPEIPRTLPEPFREITKHCLQAEPGKRWTISRILSQFESGHSKAKDLESPASNLRLVQSEKVSTEKPKNDKAPIERVSSVLPRALATQKPPAKWAYLLVLVVLIAIGLILIFRPKSPRPTLEIQSGRQQTGGTIAQPVQPTNSVAHPQSSASQSLASQSLASSSALNAGNPAPNGAAADAEGVVHRVIPEVLPGARGTIHGRILIRVRVVVNASGDVTKATVVSSHPSRYFSRIALEAARDWKFVPEPNVAQSDRREWNLQFFFTRAKTEASAAEIHH
jgi:TonB family protein